MPDVTAALRFRDALEQALDGYSSDLQRELDGTRARLADELATARLDRARVRSVAMREFRQLGERAARIGRDYEGRVTGAVEGFVGDQLAAAGEVMAGVVDVDGIRRELRAEGRRMADATMGDTPGWVSQLSTTFMVELARMRATGEDRQVVLERLLAVDLVGGRASVTRAAGNSLQLEADLDVWTVAMGLAADAFGRAGRRSRIVFRKQAIAAIDHKTTDCCLRVHGQVQDLNAPFVLTGRPRFASRMQGPPFHWYCRTATTLYTDEMERVGTPTQAMIEAAMAELLARQQTGRRVRIWPSHATSGRMK